MIHRSTRAPTTLVLILLAAMADPCMSQVPLAPGAARDTMTSFAVGGWGVNLSDRDESVKPGNNFFMSQNGGWFARTTLASDLPMSAFWRDLRRLAPRRTRAILEAAAANHAATPQSPEGQAGAFYRSFMNEAAVEAKGLTPLAAELKVIRAADTREKMARLMGNRVILGHGVFSLGIAQDLKDPTRYSIYVGQRGISLPSADYYLDPKLADVKDAYQAYVARMLTLLDWPEAETRAKDIVALETRIAGAHWTSQDIRDPVKTYNPMTVDELIRFAPGFGWRAFLEGAELGKATHLIVDARSAFPTIAAIFAESPIEVLQARQAFAVIDAGANVLNKAAFDALFDFRNKQFNSQVLVQPTRAFRAAVLADANIGDIVGFLYVKRHFSAEAKARTLEMAEYLRRAFDARLQALSWMTPATKVKARDKLARMTINIGYPDRLPDYRTLDMRPDDLYGNIVRVAAFSWRLQRERLNQPYDRSVWTLTPQTVNYSYNATTNTVEFPAAMLEPPFFDLHADPAVNYGAIGTIIGQMIVQGFDATNQHFDAVGRLSDLLTAEETRVFHGLQQAIAGQYSAVEPLPGMPVRGELVSDEAIAEIGGVQIALEAYHMSLKGRHPPVLDGFSGDQRVFLGRAQMWRAKFPPPFVRAQITAGGNSPPFLRVNGPLRNITAWYEAFGVMPGDSLFLPPEKRVPIW